MWFAILCTVFGLAVLISAVGFHILFHAANRKRRVAIGIFLCLVGFVLGTISGYLGVLN